MAKAFFRFLRGELNGYYITAYNSMLNNATQRIKEFLVERKLEQFNLNNMREEDLRGLGKFAGVFFPRIRLGDSISAVRFSDSHIVDGEEYSERGLYDTEYEAFHYEHASQDSSLPDINTLATDTLRSSLVGNEAVQGYISENETDVLDENGRVKASKVLTEPPESGGYSEFYGNQFLFLSEGEATYTELAPSLFIELLKVMQYVRYNGVSLESLCNFINIICPDGLVLIQNIEVASNGDHYIVYYRYNPDVTTVPYKTQRMSLFENIVKTKFKQIEMSEVI
jgi:hypothetical protein